MEQFTRNLEDVNELIAAIKNKSEKEVVDTMFAYCEAFAYQGFDPQYIVDTLLAKCKASKIDPSNVVTVAIMLLTIRGTSLTKIKSRSTDSLKTNIQTLERIITTNKASNLSRQDITLNRIVACWPSVTAQLATKVNRHVLPAFKDLHPILRSGFFAAICPDGEKYKPAIRANFYYVMEFDKLVKPRNPSPVGQQQGWWEAAQASKVLCDEDRVKLLELIGFYLPSAEWMADHSEGCRAGESIRTVKVPSPSLNFPSWSTGFQKPSSARSEPPTVDSPVPLAMSGSSSSLNVNAPSFTPPESFQRRDSNVSTASSVNQGAQKRQSPGTGPKQPWNSGKK